MLACPCKVASLKTEGAELGVTATGTDAVDPFGTELGAGGLTAELEFSLLAVVGALRTCVRTFVPGRAGDTYVQNS